MESSDIMSASSIVLKNLFQHEKTLFAGFLCLALAYFLEITPYIGPIGHYGGITEVMFFVIGGVILLVAVKGVEQAEYLGTHFGEPLGTLALILSASEIEVIMIVTIMLQ